MAEADSREQEVLAVNESFYTAFNQRDQTLMARVWAESAPVTCIHPGWNALHGREAVLQSWNSILNNPGQPRIVTGGATVSFFADLAIVLCRELVAGSPFIATNIFLREGGEWRMLHHQSSPVYAGA